MCIYIFREISGYLLLLLLIAASYTPGPPSAHDLYEYATTCKTYNTLTSLLHEIHCIHIANNQYQSDHIQAIGTIEVCHE